MTSAMKTQGRLRLRPALDLAVNGALLVAISWSFPRVDSEKGGQWLLMGVICGALTSVRAAYDQRLLGRPRRTQEVVALRFLGSVLAWTIVLVAASLLIGPAESPAPVERLFTAIQIPGVLQPIALPVLLVVLVALALVGYRRGKRREAELREQGRAERAAAASREASAG